MARKTSADIFDELHDDQPLQPNPEPAESKTSRPGKKQTPKKPELVSTELTESESSDLPKYLQLERKEVRIRLDQMDELTALTRRLNRARQGRGERITENTLIRVAIDLLLERSGDLSGSTEDELWDSVSS